MTLGVVLMAYGTPRRPEEIAAYYTDIRRGRPPTAEQLAALSARYDAIGGVSPLAQISFAQRDGLQAALDVRAPGEAVVELGFKHATPTIENGVGALRASGVDRVVGLVLAPHYSALSIGEYHTRAAAAAAGLPFTGIDSWAVEPAYVAFLATQVREGLKALPDGSSVVFTAHSLPERVLVNGDRYPDELRATADCVAQAAGLHDSAWSVAWQSAGRTPESWLGPDILAVIDVLAAHDVPGILVCAGGFVADHLEVLYDLDIEARQRAEHHGLAFRRTASLNAEPTVLAALADRVLTDGG